MITRPDTLLYDQSDSVRRDEGHVSRKVARLDMAAGGTHRSPQMARASERRTSSAVVRNAVIGKSVVQGESKYPKEGEVRPDS